MLDDLRSFRQIIHNVDCRNCASLKSNDQRNNALCDKTLIHPKVVYVPYARFLELAAEGFIERSGKWTGKATAKLRAEVPTCEWVGQIVKEKEDATGQTNGWW